jgi:hypothetical protein
MQQKSDVVRRIPVIAGVSHIIEPDGPVFGGIWLTLLPTGRVELAAEFPLDIDQYIGLHPIPRIDDVAFPG